MLRKLLKRLVPGAGIEPARPRGRRILSRGEDRTGRGIKAIRAPFIPQWVRTAPSRAQSGALVLVLAACAASGSMAAADEHRHVFGGSTEKLRDYLIVRPQGHPSGRPLAVARAMLYDVQAGTHLRADAWVNVTNDSNIDPTGVTCEIHVCEGACPTYDTTGRIDRIGGRGQSGGHNVGTKYPHHGDFQRAGWYETDRHWPEMAVELQCRAYNLNVTGNQEWVTVDDAGIYVEVIYAGR